MISGLSPTALAGAGCAGVLAPIVVGGGLLRATGADRRGAGAWALAFLLGYGWIGAVISALLVAGAPLGGWWGWACAAAPIAGYLRRRPVIEAARRPRTAVSRTLFALAITVLGVQFARLASEALVTPVGSHDGVAIWALKSISFFHANGIEPTLFTLDRDASLHPDYPIGLPAFGAWILANAGVADERLLKLPVPLVWLAIVVLLAAHGRRRIGRLPALWIALGFGLVDAIYYQGLLLLADLPLAAFALVAWMALTRAAPPGTGGDRWVAALALAFAVNTKNEGATLVVAAVVLSVATRAGGLRERMRSAVPLVVVPALVLLPWLLFRAHHGLYSDLTHGVFVFGQSPEAGPSAGLGRVPFLLGETLRDARVVPPWPTGMWDGFWPIASLAFLVLVVAVVRAPRRFTEAVWFAAGALTILAGFVAALCISPHDVVWHAETSLPRMLVQAAPLTAAGILSLIGAFHAVGRRPTLPTGAHGHWLGRRKGGA